MNHISIEQLQEYVDGLSDQAAAEAVYRHCDECSQCSSDLKTIREWDRLLRMVPRETLPAGFTAGVMERIGSHRRRSAAAVLVRDLAPAGVFAGVSAAVLGMAVWTGLFSSAGSSRNPGFLADVLEWGEKGLKAGGEKLLRTLPSLTGSEGAWMCLLVAAVIGAAALFDRILGPVHYWKR
jgi:anti-sigma factor RsiW